MQEHAFRVAKSVISLSDENIRGALCRQGTVVHQSNHIVFTPNDSHFKAATIARQLGVSLQDVVMIDSPVQSNSEVFMRTDPVSNNESVGDGPGRHNW